MNGDLIEARKREEKKVVGVTWGTRVDACPEAVALAEVYEEEILAIDYELNRLAKTRVRMGRDFWDGMRALHPEFDDWDVTYNHRKKTLTAKRPLDEHPQSILDRVCNE